MPDDGSSDTPSHGEGAPQSHRGDEADITTISVEEETFSMEEGEIDSFLRELAHSPAAPIEGEPIGLQRVLPQRYQDPEPLGEGGMGSVWRVFDRVLKRPVAMKVLHRRLASKPRAVSRFLEEAKITAQLQHPNIVPVYDQGLLADERQFFTLKEVRGQTLWDVIDGVHGASTLEAWGESADGWTLRRLVSALIQVSEGMAYAHAAAVCHRDLKPSNVMVGQFGEVLVMDWGLAKAQGVSPSKGGAGPEGPVIHSDRGEKDWLHTRVGAIAGTPSYMAPEQAMGQLGLGDPADVYALGAMLYTALSGRPPYVGASSRDILHKLLRGPAPPPKRQIWLKAFGSFSQGQGPGDGLEDPLIPRPLSELAQWAMARAPKDRPTASELARGLTGWLDQTRRRERGMALVEEALEMKAGLGVLRAEIGSLREQAAERLGGLKPWDDEGLKHEGWALQDKAETLAIEDEQRGVVFLQTLRSALNEDPDLPEAHRALADHYHGKMAVAEARGDARGVAAYEILLRHHDRGKYANWLEGRASFSLQTDPPGAALTLRPWVERHRRLVLGAPTALGDAPLVEYETQAGSYVVEIELEGHEPARYPINLARGESWDSAPPGSSQAQPIPLMPKGCLGADEIYIPGGWFLFGGDEYACDPLPRGRLWCDGFVIQRFPVTNGQYCGFLNALVEEGQVEVAQGHAPISSNDGRPALIYWEGGRYCVQERSPEGPSRAAEMPVVMIPWRSARAYARWYAARRSEPWRLPHDMEWLKAARGVDGRAFPWGHRLDPTWACMLNSSKGTPYWRSIYSHPIDESPYGVRGMGGNVRDFCANGYSKSQEGDRRLVHRGEDEDDDEALRMVRGGSWHSKEHFCRLGSRFADSPSNRSNSVGFRLARSLFR